MYTSTSNYERNPEIKATLGPDHKGQPKLVLEVGNTVISMSHTEGQTLLQQLLNQLLPGIEIWPGASTGAPNPFLAEAETAGAR